MRFLTFIFFLLPLTLSAQKVEIMYKDSAQYIVRRDTQYIEVNQALAQLHRKVEAYNAQIAKYQAQVSILKTQISDIEKQLKKARVPLKPAPTNAATRRPSKPVVRGKQ